MSEQITPEERKVALRNVVTEQDYLVRLKAYAQQEGTSVEALRSLNHEDLLVARQMGIDPDDQLKHKLEGLAQTVVDNIGGRL